jgi:hypothetical protein
MKQTFLVDGLTDIRPHGLLDYCNFTNMYKTMCSFFNLQKCGTSWVSERVLKSFTVLDHCSSGKSVGSHSKTSSLCVHFFREIFRCYVNTRRQDKITQFPYINTDLVERGSVLTFLRWPQHYPERVWVLWILLIRIYPRSRPGKVWFTQTTATKSYTKNV